jgi:hypothetical protein
MADYTASPLCHPQGIGLFNIEAGSCCHIGQGVTSQNNTLSTNTGHEYIYLTQF